MKVLNDVYFRPNAFWLGTGMTVRRGESLKDKTAKTKGTQQQRILMVVTIIDTMSVTKNELKKCMLVRLQRWLRLDRICPDRRLYFS